MAVESEASGVHPNLEEMKARVEARPVRKLILEAAPDQNMIPYLEHQARKRQIAELQSKLGIKSSKEPGEHPLPGSICFGFTTQYAFSSIGLFPTNL